MLEAGLHSKCSKQEYISIYEHMGQVHVHGISHMQNGHLGSPNINNCHPDSLNKYSYFCTFTNHYILCIVLKQYTIL